MIHTTAAFIRDRGMRSAIHRKPVIRGVTGGAIGAEHPGMIHGVSMTRRTRGG